MQKYTIERFLISECIIAFLSGMLSVAEHKPLYIAALYAFMGLFALLLWLIDRKRENCMAVAVLSFVVMEFILLPVMFVLEGGLFGPIPVWMCVNIMFLVLFFSGTILYTFLLCLILEYGYLLSRIYYTPDIVIPLSEKNNTFPDYLFCFLTAVLWLGFVLYTQKKTFEEENRRIDSNNEIIKEAGTARNLFFSEITSEMRLPVNSILSVTELLLKEESDRAVRTEIMEIRSASYDILSVINDALIYSELEMGGIIPEQKVYCFETLLQNIMDSVSEDILDKKLLFLVMVDPQIPRFAVGDRQRIRQIFTHLLTASLSMTTEGRIMITIAWEKEEDSDEIIFRCSISDTGKGLSAEDADRLFGTYHTFLPEKSYLNGVGLKYCISKEYLKLMGGTLKVKGLENVGMTAEFTFKNHFVDRIPLSEVTKTPKPKVLVYVGRDFRMNNWQFVMEGLKVFPCYVHSRHHFETEIRDTKYDNIFLPKDMYDELISIIAFYHCEENSYVVADSYDKYGAFGKCRIIRRPISCINLSKVLNGNWKKEDYLIAFNQESFSARGSRVLVVDDNAVNLKVAAGIFTKYEVYIDIATSGEEAIKKIEKEKYHLIFLDLIMPEMGGEDVLASIRKLPDFHYKKVPVIAVSSGSKEDMQDTMLKKGFQDYLEKPIKEKNIVECMIHFLPEELIVYKDTKKTENRQNEFIPAERGLQVNRGLSNIGYNEEAYAAILNTYYRENLKKIQTLPDIFKKEELSAFVSAAHGIKSTSASIGAMGLSSLAKELEYAGKEKNLEFISDRLPLFLKEYQLILEEIKDYLVQNGKLETAAAVPKPASKEEALTAELIVLLKEKMDRMDLKSCSDLLAKLSAANYGETYNMAISKMKEAYDRFDFHTAKEELNRILLLVRP